MTLKDFERYLDLYGPHFIDWPEHFRDEAEECAASSDEARRLLETAQRFDRLFYAHDIPPPPSTADLVAAITSRPIPTSSDTGFWRFFWLKPAILASCLLAGIAIGNFSHADHQDLEESFNLSDGALTETVDE